MIGSGSRWIWQLGSGFLESHLHVLGFEVFEEGAAAEFEAVAGMPPSVSARQKASGESGVMVVGLTTTVHPAANAGPSFQLRSETG